MKKFLLGFCIVVALLFATYRIWLPIVFVGVSKGNFSKDSLIIDKVNTSKEATNSSGQTMAADAEHKFVSIDMTIMLTLSEVDYYDFQLVKRNDYDLGHEENVGDNFRDNYFTVLPLDKEGSISKEWDSVSEKLKMRLIYEVPKDSKNGYLFYWGEYFGPLRFD